VTNVTTIFFDQLVSECDTWGKNQMNFEFSADATQSKAVCLNRSFAATSGNNTATSVSLRLSDGNDCVFDVVV
jgi:type 1 fimbria pilin